MRRYASNLVACLIVLWTPYQALGADLKHVKFAYIQVIDLLPYFIADSKGYFKQEGLNVEPIVLTGGPAVISAVESGSADVGFAGGVSLMNSRLHGLSLKFFSGLLFEQPPDIYPVVFIGREKSGVKDAKDLSGKVVAFNTFGGQCELIARVGLAKAGLLYDSVKITTLPFPQMRAALAIGNIDAACVGDPFLSDMQKANVGSIVMAGMVRTPTAKQEYFNSGIFASDRWLKANEDTAIRFKRALGRGIEDLESDPAAARQLLTKYMKFSPELASEIKLGGFMTDFPISSLQSVIDSAFETGMIPHKMDAREIGLTLR